ncbi:MAG: glycogen/starch synthase [Planctomycetaceae bacterium]
MLAFVTYETAYSPCGGIAAVLGRLPGRMSALAGSPSLVFTPYHHRLPRLATLATTVVGEVGVAFEGRTIPVQLLRHDGPAPHLFVRPADPAFFAGERHPYDVAPGTLLRDSLFFGAAVARAIRVLQPGAPWTLLLQDWEAATVALAVAGQAARPRMFLTLHNSYDVAVSGTRLADAGLAPHACPGETVLQRALGLCEWPVFTVSTQFARDLVEDPFQAQVLAPHLSGLLGPRLVGIDNGLFTDRAVPEPVLTAARQGDPGPLGHWKQEQQSAFLRALDELRPDATQPVWGDLKQFARDASPLFVMAGRDDGRQKGYDVAAGAARAWLEQRCPGRFVFFPILSDEGLEAVDFLRELAADFPEGVLVFPFRFTAGFVQALRGATCGLMPSLYEPFGMANEFYLNGTLGIGRATGGILQQIVPWTRRGLGLPPTAGDNRVELERTSARSSAQVAGASRPAEETLVRGGIRAQRPALGGMAPAVARRVERVHSATAAPTGFLFHEVDGLPSELADWQEINRTGTRAEPDRWRARRELPLFRSLVDSLVESLEQAAEVSSRPGQYAQLLVAGLDHLERNFSWDQAASEYLRYAGG